MKRKRACKQCVHGLCLSIRILIALGNEKYIGIEHFLNVGNAFMHSVERINPFPTISHQRHDKLEFITGYCVQAVVKSAYVVPVNQYV